MSSILDRGQLSWAVHLLRSVIMDKMSGCMCQPSPVFLTTTRQEGIFFPFNRQRNRLKRLSDLPKVALLVGSTAMTG